MKPASNFATMTITMDPAFLGSSMAAHRLCSMAKKFDPLVDAVEIRASLLSMYDAK